MGGKKSRNKGQKAERELAKILSHWYGKELRRTPLSGGWAKDHVQGDIAGDADFPLSVECKTHKKFRLEWLWDFDCEVQSWWEQTLKQCKLGKLAFLCIRQEGGRWWCVTTYGMMLQKSQMRVKNVTVMELVDWLECNPDPKAIPVASSYRTPTESQARASIPF